jgi:hypothetical protein
MNGTNTDSTRTLKQLKEECKSRNLKVSGTKPQLLERLRVFEKGEVDDDGGRGEPANKWTGMSAKQLKEECKKHGIAVAGNKVVLQDRLAAFEEMQAQVAREAIPMRDLSEQDLIALQEMEELKYEIDCRKDDLVEYRSHMARHLSEDVSAADKLETLKDDEAIVTSDYKMKILSCFFRENQKKWFGKRGTSLLGFMITTNSSDEESKAKGLKEVTFVMMVTDDCLQDDWGVACAKSVLYKEYLPEHIKKVHFISDGAGCFKSQLHRALQPFWILWTGVDEIVCRITPAGDGKSALDGMFGRLNTVLRSAVDMGASYWNSETITRAIEDSNGLSSTQFARFAPERSQQLKAKVSTMNFESVLLTTLDPDRDANDQSTLAFKHSRYGEGKQIKPDKDITFSWLESKGERTKKKEDSTPITGVYNANVSFDLFHH